MSTHTIAHYTLRIGLEQTVKMPQGSRILGVETHAGNPTLIALVDPDAPEVKRRIRCLSKGQQSSEHAVYLGTFQLVDHTLIWHAFDMGEVVT